MENKQNYDGILDEVIGVENPLKATPKQLLIGGWQDVNMNLLSYKGKYYPEGTVISVKPFSTKEVIHFTSINENNPLEVDRAMRYLIDECVQVRVGNRVVNTSEILFNIDRFIVILLARTYSDMRTDLTFETKCSVDKCGHEQKIKVIPQNLVFTEDKISKYYDSSSSTFVIKMKGISGDNIIVEYLPHSISENTELFDFMMLKKDEISESDLKVMAKLFPFMRSNMRNNKCKDMEDVYHTFKGLTKDEIIDLTRLSEKVSLDFTNKVSSKCGDCGHLEDVHMRFPNGIGVVVIDKDADDDFLL